jgi:hypothetical protein
MLDWLEQNAWIIPFLLMAIYFAIPPRYDPLIQ